MVKAALLRAILNLDEAGAQAVYNALAAHAQNEAEHVENLKDGWSADDRAEGEKVEKNLESIDRVVEACEAALCSLAETAAA